MNLFEIEQSILECIDMETGEVIDLAKLEQLQMDRSTKIENIACWIRNLTEEAEALKKQKQIFADRQSSAEKKAESLKRYLSAVLAGEQFKTDKVSISFRKSDSVDVFSMESLVEYDTAGRFLKIKEPEADKTAIKAALKEGANIPGCVLVEKQNIQIK